MARTKVHGEYLDPSVISAQTEVTAVGSDHMLIFDATDNALKKALLSDLIETVGSTPTFTSLTVASDTDVTVDIGRAKIGNVGFSDFAGFAHRDNATTTNYALLQYNTGETYLNAATGRDINFRINNSNVGIFNSDGNFGIGTTSLTNNTLGKTTYFGNNTSTITGDSSQARFWLGNNWYYNSGDKFIGTGYANLYTQQSGTHQFLTSTASGTAGAAATFKNVMTLDANGLVGIGDSSPAAKLEIKQGSGNWYEGIRINRSSNTTQFGTFSNNSGATFIGAADTTGGSNNALLFGNSTNGTTFTERARISSDGKIGIGTASPEKRLHITDSTQANQTIRFGNPSATPYGEINYDSSGFEHLYITSKGTTTGYGNIVFNTGGTPSEAMRILASGGITFNGDTAAANALDDYEEGTFTPVVNNGTYTYSYRRGHYVKIGNLVHIHIGLKLNTASPTGSAASISGLPFTSASYGSYREPHARVGVAGLCVTADLSYNLSFFVGNSATTVYARTSANNSDTAVASSNLWQNGTFIKLQMCYTVS